MSVLIVDASVAVKWVVEEDGSKAALALRRGTRLAAPDLLHAECANILWKKVQRSQLTREEATIAASLLARAGLEILPTGWLLEEATKLAIDLAHPAYDCIYLALAARRQWRFVTADERLLGVVRDRAGKSIADLCEGLADHDPAGH